jgi:hypothetical protein
LKNKPETVTHEFTVAPCPAPSAQEAEPEATVQRRNLEDFSEYCKAHSELDQQKAKLADIAELCKQAQAEEFTAMQGVKAAPPPYLTRRVEHAETELRSQRARVKEAEAALNQVAASCRRRVSKAAAHDHRRLMQVVALRGREFLVAIRNEQAFRDDLANRDLLVTGEFIMPRSIPNLSTPDELESLEIVLNNLLEDYAHE